MLAAATCETRATALYLERNAFLCGASVFLFFIMRRLLDIQAQLFSMRSAVKAGQAESALLAADAALGPSPEPEQLPAPSKEAPAGTGKYEGAGFGGEEVVGDRPAGAGLRARH